MYTRLTHVHKGWIDMPMYDSPHTKAEIVQLRAVN